MKSLVMKLQDYCKMFQINLLVQKMKEKDYQEWLKSKRLKCCNKEKRLRKFLILQNKLDVGRNLI